jgi:hypothetical protein
MHKGPAGPFSFWGAVAKASFNRSPPPADAVQGHCADSQDNTTGTGDYPGSGGGWGEAPPGPPPWLEDGSEGFRGAIATGICRA